jgi:hypothetical protein
MLAMASPRKIPLFPASSEIPHIFILFDLLLLGTRGATFAIIETLKKSPLKERSFQGGEIYS